MITAGVIPRGMEAEGGYPVFWDRLDDAPIPSPADARIEAAVAWHICHPRPVPDCLSLRN